MKVLIVSRQFPAYHPKAGQSTRFVENILSGIKKHTLRENKTGKFKNGDTVSLRYWSDKPYCSKQIEFAQAKIKVESLDIKAKGNVSLIFLADNDGLSSSDFVEWFGGLEKASKWKGSCIWFNNIKPTKETTK